MGPSHEQAIKAILVVHGIGAQNRGETTQKLLKGLSRVPGSKIPPPTAMSTDAEIAGVPIRIYEVYWADLLKGEMTENTFSFREFQGLSWFPWLNRHRGVNPKGKYPAITTFIWTLLLPLVTTMLVAPFYGARLLATLFDREYRDKVRTGNEEGSFWQRAKLQAERTSHERTVIENTIDEYVADVFNYVNSAGQARYPDGREMDVPESVQDAYGHIIQRFRKQLTEAASQCGEIQILAHSLGTVVAYHGLFGLLGNETAEDESEKLEHARRKVTHLYTIGSPLEKIGFFWPKLINPAAAPGSLSLQWDNFVSWFDPVAGVLKNFDQWGTVHNKRLLGGGFVTGHVVYEKNPMFLGKFVEGIGGKPFNMAGTYRERIRDWIILLAETVLAPAVFLFLTLLGGAIVVAVLFLLPWLISLLFRPDFMPQLNPVIFDRFAFAYAAMLLLGVVASSIGYAKRSHKVAWCPRQRSVDPERKAD